MFTVDKHLTAQTANQPEAGRRTPLSQALTPSPDLQPWQGLGTGWEARAASSAKPEAYGPSWHWRWGLSCRSRLGGPRGCSGGSRGSRLPGGLAAACRHLGGQQAAWPLILFVIESFQHPRDEHTKLYRVRLLSATVLETVSQGIVTMREARMATGPDFRGGGAPDASARSPRILASPGAFIRGVSLHRLGLHVPLVGTVALG